MDLPSQKSHRNAQKSNRRATQKAIPKITYKAAVAAAPRPLPVLYVYIPQARSNDVKLASVPVAKTPALALSASNVKSRLAPFIPNPSFTIFSLRLLTSKSFQKRIPKLNGFYPRRQAIDLENEVLLRSAVVTFRANGLLPQDLSYRLGLRLSAVYGPSTSAGRHQFFSNLLSFAPRQSVSWILCGDFNIILDSSESTGKDHSLRNMQAFANVTSVLGLIDLTLPRRNFTWSNNKAIPTLVRLDRFFVNFALSQSFYNTMQEALANTSSDHTPLLCTCKTVHTPANLFRLENCFLLLLEFSDLVLNFWFSLLPASNSMQFHNKLSLLSKEINYWAKGRVSTLKCQI